MSLKTKVVVVTGGAGFIGSHLVEDIIKQEPEKVVVIDCYYNGRNRNLCGSVDSYFHPFDYEHAFVVTQDASDFRHMKRIFTELQPDVVFDLAVLPLPASLEHPVETYRTNVELGMTMCELARLDLYKTLIHFSSSEVYGTCVCAPMSEDHPLNGRTTYAASKAAVDQLAIAYRHTFGIDVSIVRPFNTYGPRQNDKGYAAVIPITINRILSGKPPIIHGDGKQTRDYTYVTDVARAAIDVYYEKNTRGKAINIASGKEITIISLIEKIIDIMEYHGHPDYEPELPGDVRRHIADISLAESLLGYTPWVSLETGLIKTIEWYMERAK